MFKLLGKKIIAFLRSKILLNWTFGIKWGFRSKPFGHSLIYMHTLFIGAGKALAILPICAGWPESMSWVKVQNFQNPELSKFQS